MKIAVTGATGFIGRALCLEMSGAHEVVVLSRSKKKAASVFGNLFEIIEWNTHSADGWGEMLEGIDAVVNLAGASLAAKRWTKEYKREILESRTKCSRVLIDAIKKLKKKPTVVVMSSAIGFYGDRQGEQLDEGSIGGEGFLADVCRKRESYSAQFEEMGIRTVVIRTSIVLGLSGGAFPKMLKPFNFYAGCYWGKGKQWVSWIYISDEIAAIKFLIENDALSGVFNLAAPQPQKNRNFFKTVGKVFEKPCWGGMPGFVLKMLLGDITSELFLASQRVYPKRLTDAGFKFEYPELEKTLETIRTELCYTL